MLCAFKGDILAGFPNNSEFCITLDFFIVKV